MALQYLHSSACSRTCFLYEVSHSVLVLACLFLKKTGILQASPSKNIIFDKEHLYTATYYCNQKENLSLVWK
jgi:hypothetical protein